MQSDQSCPWLGRHLLCRSGDHTLSVTMAPDPDGEASGRWSDMLPGRTTSGAAANHRFSQASVRQGRTTTCGSAARMVVWESVSACKFFLACFAGQAQYLLGIEAETWFGGLDRSRPAPRP